MRQRWENALHRYDEEKPRVRQEMEAAKARRTTEAGVVGGQGSADLSRSEDRTRGFTTS
jgi:hypothetical protein